jgi:hypothetical protein
MLGAPVSVNVMPDPTGSAGVDEPDAGLSISRARQHVAGRIERVRMARL